MNGKFMRILLIKRGAMGDILMATPLIRQLKQNIPNLKLDFLTSKDCVSVVQNNPYLDNIMALDGATFSLKKIFTLIKYVWKLRNRYDYVFVLDKHYYFSFIGRLISKNTVGYWRDNLSVLFLKYHVRYNDVKRYHGLYYLDLLQKSGLSGVNYSDYYLDFPISNSSIQSSNQIYETFNLTKNDFVVVVNSGGNQSFESSGIRMLPKNKIMLLLSELQKITKVVLLGSKIDEINYNNYLSSLSDNSRIINLAGKCSLEQSVVIMSKAKKIYTTDCGAMHLALSQKLFTQLVCFFGPTCPDHVLPPNMQIKYYWQDQNIFNQDYPLYGELPRQYGFFDKLDINQVVRESR